MNLIDQVKELQKLEGRLQAIYERQRDTRSPNYAILERIEIERKLLDAAHELLSILGEIRPEDAEILADWLYQIEEEYGEDGANPKNQPITKLLRRYQAMAKRMEAESK